MTPPWTALCPPRGVAWSQHPHQTPATSVSLDLDVTDVTQPRHPPPAPAWSQHPRPTPATSVTRHVTDVTQHQTPTPAPEMTPLSPPVAGLTSTCLRVLDHILLCHQMLLTMTETEMTMMMLKIKAMLNIRICVTLVTSRARVRRR